MKSGPRSILSLFLSATLAFGTIPAPALAQMADEAMGEEPAATALASTEPAAARPATVDGAMGESPVSDPQEAEGGEAEMGETSASAVAGEDRSAEPSANLGVQSQGPAKGDATTAAYGGMASPSVGTVHDENETPGLSTQNNLPASYSSANYGYVTSVRDQRPLDTCWAFATIASVEASVLRNGVIPGANSTNLDLSERHLAYFTFNTAPDPLGNTGGDKVLPRSDPFTLNDYDGQWSYLNNSCSAYVTGMVLSGWMGAADEQTAPYDPLYNYVAYRLQGVPYQQFLDEMALSPDIARSDAVHLKNLSLVSVADRDKVKQAIMDQGAVAYAYYDNYHYYSWLEVSENTWRKYVRYAGDEGTNHIVTIIGWDDTVDRNNFVSEGCPTPPEHDGAWLCKNSWGIEEGGPYFWISYDDKYSLSDASVVAFEMEPADKEDNLYYHDGGVSDFYNYVDSGGSVASVFTAKANDTGELLDAVSFYTYDTNTNYSVQIYMDPERASDPTSGTPVLAQPLTGKTEFVGLHKIDLSQAINLYPGATYAVVATFSHDNGSRVRYGVDVSVPANHFYVTETVARAGESYERNNPRVAWKDLATSTDIDEGDEPNCNARVRAYTKNTDLTGRMTLESAVIEEIPAQPFHGEAVCPEPKVTIDGHLLRKDVDYTLSYRENESEGIATVVATGRGSYSGEKAATFRVGSVPVTGPTSRDGVDWSAVYDPAYYAEQNPDVAAWATRADGTVDGDRLLQHFVNNGAREGRRSKDGFELASYYNANADLRRAFGTSDWSKYYRHYATNGHGENRACAGVGELRGFVTSRDGVDWSPAYDANYYAARNGDVDRWARRSFSSGSVLDDAALLQHFVGNGAKEGRRSKDGFDLASYFNANADLRAAFGGTADLSKYYRHYATNGHGENRACSGVGSLQGAVVSRDGVDWSPVYDRAYYAQQNGDVASWATRSFNSGSVVDDFALLQHFVGNGSKEGRRSKDSFELASYYNANADLRRAFGTSDWSRYYRHYATNGSKEGRTSKGVSRLQGFPTSSGGVDWAPVYDANEYASRNADLARWATRSFSSGSVLDDVALLSHFVSNGTKEGRRSKESFELASYYNANADLRRAFGTDWSKYYRHFATNGARENRACKGVTALRGFPTSSCGVDWAPVYDANEYASHNPDLASWARRSFNSGSVLDDAALLSHFVNNGQGERRVARSSFIVTAYRTLNADLDRAFGNDWPRYYRHYCTNGQREGRRSTLPDLSEASVDRIPDQVYDGSEHRPRPAVRMGGVLLLEGVDYELSYANNVNAGTAVLTVRGIGAYVGSREERFTIRGASLAGADVEFSYESKSYISGNGYDRLTPAGVAVSVGGRELEEGVDYELSYRDCIMSCVAVVTGIGNWRDSTCARANVIVAGKPTTVSEPILGTNIRDVEVVGWPRRFVLLEGGAQFPAPTLVHVGSQLVEGTDYSIAFSNTDTPGSAGMKIDGLGSSSVAGEYFGTHYLYFEIVDAATADLERDVFFATVTGGADHPVVTLAGEVLSEGEDYVLTARGDEVAISGVGEYNGVFLYKPPA